MKAVQHHLKARQAVQHCWSCHANDEHQVGVAEWEKARRRDCINSLARPDSSTGARLVGADAVLVIRCSFKNTARLQLRSSRVACALTAKNVKTSLQDKKPHRRTHGGVSLAKLSRAIAHGIEVADARVFAHVGQNGKSSCTRETACGYQTRILA